MCGRTTLVAGADAIREVFGVDEVPELRPRYNQAPSGKTPSLMPIIRAAGKIEIVQWGLPHREFWNVRIEKVTRRAELRCLVIVDGFVEWKLLDGKNERGKRRKQAFHFTRPDRRPFAMGGVVRPVGPFAAALVTTAPTIEIIDVHDRQPVVLRREDWEPWLAGEVRRGTLSELHRVPIGSRINDAALHDDPECLEPVVAQEIRQLRLF